MSFKEHLQKANIDPQPLILRGFLHPPDLALHIGYESKIGDAVISWVRDIQDGKQLDLQDSYDRFGARALLLHQHELAHFFSFIFNPLARVSQGLVARKNFYWVLIARLLYSVDMKELRLPLSRWKETYQLEQTLAQKISKLEDKAKTSKALLDMLLMGPIKDPAPIGLSSLSNSNNFWWPWHIFYNAAYENHKKGGITFRDIQEGYAMNYEFMALAQFGVSMDEYLELRAEVTPQYWIVPNIISSILQEYREFTLGIVMAITPMIPAAALIIEWDEWQLFDATNCLVLVINAVASIGPWDVSEISNTNALIGSAGEYVKKVFDKIFHSRIEPADLLLPHNQARIERAFGFDDEEWSQLEEFSPAIKTISQMQTEMNTVYKSEWPQRFFSINAAARWFPPLIMFTDEFRRFSDLPTYHSVRHTFLRSHLAEGIWHQGNFDEFLRWSYGGVGENGGKIEVLSAYLRNFVGCDIDDIRFL